MTMTVPPTGAAMPAAHHDRLTEFTHAATAAAIAAGTVALGSVTGAAACAGLAPVAATAVGTAGLVAIAAGVLGAEAYVAGHIAGSRLVVPNYEIDETVGKDLPGTPLELAVFGDSTVKGVGAPTEPGSLAVQTAQQAALLLGRPIHVQGFGVIGARVKDVAAEQLPAAIARGAHFDDVLVVIGGNDVTHVSTPGAMTRAMTSIVEQARQLSTAQGVVAGIPRFLAATGMPQPIRAGLDAYSTVLARRQRLATGAAGGLFVDTANESSVPNQHVPGTVSVDGFHPSVLGYRLWADVLAPRVASVLRPVMTSSSATPGGGA